MLHDVIIIGCGPVGALAANFLGRAGLSVLVLEKEAEPHPLPRAVHIDHEMMRLFQSAGVINRILPDTRETDGHLHIGADHGVIRYLGTVGKPRPYGWANDYFFYQPELEAHLRAGFAAMPNVHLRTGATFAGIEQRDERVTISFTENGTDQAVQARWAIGCDGARSPVRKALGVELDDLDFDEPWLVVDVAVEGPVGFPTLTGVPAGADLQRLSVMMCDPNRPATIVPGRGNHRRWEFMLLPGEEDHAMMQPETVAALLSPYLQGVPHEIVRASTYRFHGLVAEHWQIGNVFLAGDAAHQTPPFFGQGMCHGFRDVANLAWKMIAIAQDRANPALLESYQPERDPHVRSVIGAAVAAGRYICILDPAKAAARDAELRAKANEHQAQTAADLIPPIATGIILAGSAAAGERFIQPLVGGAKLDEITGAGWRLFTRGCASPEDGVSIIEANDLPEILAWLDKNAAEAVLVRPDHYVFGTGTVGTLLAARNHALGQSHSKMEAAA